MYYASKCAVYFVLERMTFGGVNTNNGLLCILSLLTDLALQSKFVGR
jgi:hypothetical protein